MHLTNRNKMHSYYSTSLICTAHCIRWTWIEYQSKLARQWQLIMYYVLCVSPKQFTRKRMRFFWTFFITHCHFDCSSVHLFHAIFPEPWPWSHSNSKIKAQTFISVYKMITILIFSVFNQSSHLSGDISEPKTWIPFGSICHF